MLGTALLTSSFALEAPVHSGVGRPPFDLVRGFGCERPDLVAVRDDSVNDQQEDDDCERQEQQQHEPRARRPGPAALLKPRDGRAGDCGDDRAGHDRGNDCLDLRQDPDRPDQNQPQADEEPRQEAEILEPLRRGEHPCDLAGADFRRPVRFSRCLTVPPEVRPDHSKDGTAWVGRSNRPNRVMRAGKEQENNWLTQFASGLGGAYPLGASLNGGSGSDPPAPGAVRRITLGGRRNPAAAAARATGLPPFMRSRVLRARAETARRSKSSSPSSRFPRSARAWFGARRSSTASAPLEMLAWCASRLRPVTARRRSSHSGPPAIPDRSPGSRSTSETTIPCRS